MENAAQVYFAPTQGLDSAPFEIFAALLPAPYANSNAFDYRVKNNYQAEVTYVAVYIVICANQGWTFLRIDLFFRLQNKYCI